jgi:NADH-quinone oxidoreductase subunit N
VSFQQLLQNTFHDTLQVSLVPFVPELILCGLIILILLAKMILPRWQSGPFWLTLFGSCAAISCLKPWATIGGSVIAKTTPLFTGMLVNDPFSIYFRSLLIGFIVLFALMTRLTHAINRESDVELFTLVLGATIGMCLMVSANHMLIVFLAIEMVSVPSYALAAIQRGNRLGSEAAMKYAVYGAAAAGVMLYGISLLVGTLGTAHLPTMGSTLAGILSTPEMADRSLVLVLSGLMILVGIAFKLSAFPFHNWAPDVFEGATAEVAAFLSIASKAAALGLLIRLVIGLGWSENPEALAALAPVRTFFVATIGILAAMSCTFGNLAAYAQTELKRLFAYSTIAHAGYMLMPVAAIAALMGSHPADARSAVAATAFYVSIYLFMNLIAFALIAIVRDETGSESIDRLRGLVYHSPGIAILFSATLFSFIGLPPFAGFAAKFAALAYTWLGGPGCSWLVIIGVLNTAISLFYYLRLAKTMTLEKPLDQSIAKPIRIPMLTTARGLYLLALSLPIFIWGIWWNGLFSWAKSAASLLIQ